MYEYETTWSFLKSGGILLSDDTNLSEAFRDFAKEVEIEPIQVMYPVQALKRTLR